MRSLALVALLFMACGSRAEAPGTAAPAAPSATPTAAATVTASPTPTARPNPTAGPGTYTSLGLAYRVDLPSGWRRSACQSTRGITAPPATETFTDATIDGETATDTGAGQDLVTVHVEDSSPGQTALAWLESGKLGFSSQSHFEKASIDGHDAARIVPNDGSASGVFALAARGHIYTVSIGIRDQAARSPATALMSSFHVLTDAELADARASLASPSPAPARTAEEVADTLARGFAQKDTTLLATVASPCLTQGYEQAGPAMAATSKMLAGLAQQFGSGLNVAVTPRPFLDQSPTYVAVSSKWTGGGQPDRTAKLMIVVVGSTWYWDGWIFAQPVR